MKYIRLSIPAAVMLAVTACGGGGASLSSTNNGTTVGVISSFGSVFVNGVEFETDSAGITVDGQAVNENDLKVGMLVTIKGSVDVNAQTGNALSIRFTDDLEGLVLSNNVDLATMTGVMNVMGQTVHVKAETVFESRVTGVNTVDDVTAGQILEVSGHSSGNGTIYATRLEVKAADLATYLISYSEGMEVKGAVSNLDESSNTFMLGDMTVNFAGAILDDLPGGLGEGFFVEVKSIEGLNPDGQLIASKVELENDGVKGYQGDRDEEYEVEGVVTTAYADNTFSVNGQSVRVTGSTEFEDGLDRNSLIKGVMVEVEGYFDINGALLAVEIKQEDAADQEIEGTIQQISASGVNAGMITLTNGMTIHVSNKTMMKDERDEGVMPELMFNLTHLLAGDYVEVHGYANADGSFEATRLERDDS